MNEERHENSRAQAGRQPGSEHREAAHHDAAAPATLLTAVLGLRTHAGVATTDHPLIARHSCSAHACRDSEVVCARVELTVGADARLGLTARERRFFTVRFLDGLEFRLRAQLTELVRRRGAAARRAAERMEPIEIVFDDPLRGLQRITGCVQPPQRRHDDLQDIRFGLREPAR